MSLSGCCKIDRTFTVAGGLNCNPQSGICERGCRCCMPYTAQTEGHCVAYVGLFEESRKKDDHKMGYFGLMVFFRKKWQIHCALMLFKKENRVFVGRVIRKTLPSLEINSRGLKFILVYRKALK